MPAPLDRCCSCCWPAVFAGLRGLAALPGAAGALADLHRPGGRGRRDRTSSLTEADRAVIDAHPEPRPRPARLDPGALRRRLCRCRLDHARRRPPGRGRRAVRPAGSGPPGGRLGSAYAGRRRLGGATPGWAPSPARSPAAWPRSDPARPWPPPGPTAPSPPTRPPDEFIASRSDQPLPDHPRRRRAHGRTRSSPRWPADDTRTLIVTGIGPSPGSDDRGLQVFYRLGTTFPGWVTSASTRRTGHRHPDRPDPHPGRLRRPDGRPAPAAIDGSPLAVDARRPDCRRCRRPPRGGRRPLRHDPARLPGGRRPRRGWSWRAGVVGAVRRRRPAGPVRPRPSGRFPARRHAAHRIGAVGVQRPAAARPQPRRWSSRGPSFAAAAFGLGRRTGVPPVIVASALIGGRLHRRCRPGRTAAVRVAAQLPARSTGCAGTASATPPSPAYATTGLLVAGYFAHRLLADGRRRAAVIAVARDRFRHRDLRGLAVDGQRLRRGDRADPAGALAAPGAVRHSPSHRCGCSRSAGRRWSRSA